MLNGRYRGGGAAASWDDQYYGNDTEVGVGVGTAAGASTTGTYVGSSSGLVGAPLAYAPYVHQPLTNASHVQGQGHGANRSWTPQIVDATGRGVIAPFVIPPGRVLRDPGVAAFVPRSARLDYSNATPPQNQRYAARQQNQQPKPKVKPLISPPRGEAGAAAGAECEFCNRKPSLVHCGHCEWAQGKLRIRMACPTHPKVHFTQDLTKCPGCSKADGLREIDISRLSSVNAKEYGVPDLQDTSSKAFPPLVYNDNSLMDGNEAGIANNRESLMDGNGAGIANNGESLMDGNGAGIANNGESMKNGKGVAVVDHDTSAQKTNPLLAALQEKIQKIRDDYEKNDVNGGRLNNNNNSVNIVQITDYFKQMNLQPESQAVNVEPEVLAEVPEPKDAPEVDLEEQEKYNDAVDGAASFVPSQINFENEMNVRPIPTTSVAGPAAYAYCAGNEFNENEEVAARLLRNRKKPLFDQDAAQTDVTPANYEEVKPTIKTCGEVNWIAVCETCGTFQVIDHEITSLPECISESCYLVNSSELIKMYTKEGVLTEAYYVDAPTA